MKRTLSFAIVFSYIIVCITLTWVLSHPWKLDQRADFSRWFLTPQPQLSKGYHKTLPDLASINVIAERKDTFFGLLEPMIDTHNDYLLNLQLYLDDLEQQLIADTPLNNQQQRWLQQKADYYRVSTNIDADMMSNEYYLEVIEGLKFKAQPLPASMVMAQAAIESAWGTSRFARKANNLFGQWCFEAGCGLVPQQRSAGANHEVKKFATIEAALQAYFRNINSHPAYRELRDLRWQELQQPQQPLSGLTLINGLERYSERGDAYIRDLKLIIRGNQLETRTTTEATIDAVNPQQ